jgi:hypothetical protein
MGLFGKKKAVAAATSPPAPATTAPYVPPTDRQEPLLEHDDPVVVATESYHDPMDPEEGDADLTVPGAYYNVEKPKNEGWIQTQIPNLGMKNKAKRLLTCCGLPASVKWGLIGASVIGVVAYGLIAGATNHKKELNVAFIGNSYFFVNDLPRLMETISGGMIFQDSCLHGSGSFLNLLKTGNGMYYKWNTNNALMDDVQFVSQSGQVSMVYDYGACSVPQLLLGQDAMLSYGNDYGKYIDDGNNPCIQDQSYMEYEQSFNYTEKWDYVVMVDQSKRMCFDDARAEALMALNYTYAPLLQHIKARGLIVQPHAFWSNSANMSGLEDVPTFTSRIMDGAKIYKEFLNGEAKLSKKAKISPVGDAFLTVWEEDNSLWEKLFLADGIHPSASGSYLYANVLYASMYGFMPKKDIAILEDTAELFYNARRLQAGNNGTLYPSEDEATYLFKVAKRVTLLFHKPSSLKTVGQTAEAEDEEVETDDYVQENQDYQDYDEDQDYEN